MNRGLYCIGYGQVSCVASNVDELKNALRIGKSGIDMIKGFNVEKYKAKYAGEIDEYSYGNKIFEISKKAMIEALYVAGIELEDLKYNKRVGFVFGTSLGDMSIYENYFKPNINCKNKNLKISVIGSISSRLKRFLKLKGPSFTISNTCVTGISTVLLASQLIRSGQIDTCIVGSTDVLSEFIFSGMDALKALSRKNELKPFSEDRDGIILGEGSAFLVLTSEKSQKKDIYSIIESYSVTNDAVHITAPDKEANGLTNAIKEALSMAELCNKDIKCVFSCGTGTRYNDEMQAKAISKVWSDMDIPVTVIKPLFGHTLAASGLIESIGIMIMMNENYIAPIGKEYQIDLQIDNINLIRDIHYLKNDRSILLSSGFSGVNGALIIKSHKTM